MAAMACPVRPRRVGVRAASIALKRLLLLRMGDEYKPSADTEPNLQHTKTMSWETHVFPPTFIYNYYIHETHTHIYLHVVF